MSSLNRAQLQTKSKAEQRSVSQEQKLQLQVYTAFSVRRLRRLVLLPGDLRLRLVVSGAVEDGSLEILCASALDCKRCE